jgi:transposase
VIVVNKVEVLPSNDRRRRWSAKQKKALLSEADQPGMSVHQVARKYGLHPNQLYLWRVQLHKQFGERPLTEMRADEELVPASVVHELRQQIRELERLLGRKTMENEILKDALGVDN